MGQGECQSGKKSHLGEMKPRSSFILSDPSELSGVSCAPQGSLGGNTAFSNASHGPRWASPRTRLPEYALRKGNWTG